MLRLFFIETKEEQSALTEGENVLTDLDAKLSLIIGDDTSTTPATLR